MIYLITYHSGNEQRTLEWVTPKAWTPLAIAECFQLRFPEARLLEMVRVE